jgi:hypothetical protein
VHGTWKPLRFWGLPMSSRGLTYAPNESVRCALRHETELRGTRGRLMSFWISTSNCSFQIEVGMGGVPLRRTAPWRVRMSWPASDATDAAKVPISGWPAEQRHAAAMPRRPGLVHVVVHVSQPTWQLWFRSSRAVRQPSDVRDSAAIRLRKKGNSQKARSGRAM